MIDIKKQWYIQGGVMLAQNICDCAKRTTWYDAKNRPLKYDKRVHVLTQFASKSILNAGYVMDWELYWFLMDKDTLEIVDVKSKYE